MSSRPKPEIVLAAILGMGPMVGIFLGGALAASARSWPREWLYDIALWVALATGMFMAVVPSSLAALSVALRWGWDGFVPYLATMTLCATVFFLLVRRFAAESVRRRIETHPKLAPFVHALDRRAFILLFAIRLAPVLVYSWTNALFAISRLSLPKYVVGTALGAAPRVVAGFAAGQAGLSIVQELRSGKVPGWAAWVVLGGAVAFIAVLGIVGKAWIETIRGEKDSLSGKAS